MEVTWQQRRRIRETRTTRAWRADNPLPRPRVCVFGDGGRLAGGIASRSYNTLSSERETVMKFQVREVICNVVPVKSERARRRSWNPCNLRLRSRGLRLTTVSLHLAGSNRPLRKSAVRRGLRAKSQSRRTESPTVARHEPRRATKTRNKTAAGPAPACRCLALRAAAQTTERRRGAPNGFFPIWWRRPHSFSVNRGFCWLPERSFFPCPSIAHDSSARVPVDLGVPTKMHIGFSATGADAGILPPTGHGQRLDQSDRCLTYSTRISGNGEEGRKERKSPNGHVTFAYNWRVFGRGSLSALDATRDFNG